MDRIRDELTDIFRCIPNLELDDGSHIRVMKVLKLSSARYKDIADENEIMTHDSIG